MKRLAGLLLALFCFVQPTQLHAQLPGGAPSGVNTALLKLFGQHNNFSVSAEMQIFDTEQKVSMSMDSDMAVLDGKLRMDVDVSKVKSAALPPQLAQQYKAMGMDRFASILRPDKNRMYLVFPNLKSYLDVDLPKEAAASIKSEPKMEKTPLGKETVNGHPCTKSKVVMTDGKGKKEEITVWDASDLKDFPVKVQMTEEGQNIQMQYKDVQFTKPDAKQFDPPVGFAKLDMAQFQTLMMKKMTGGASDK